MQDFSSVRSFPKDARICHCRICGSERISYCGDVEYYFGYARPIYDCQDCGCRFTLHDNKAYDLLYSEQSSFYSRYTTQAETCKRLFDLRDRASLRAVLSQGSKYRFIIDALDSQPADARILEIGSSCGHLTSYFILCERMITGVDVSLKAVAAARAAFGDHFVLAGDSAVEAHAPYDIIFHVGTIGCVADPIGTTRNLLGMLKPAGLLFFNAPNRDACTLCDQLWFDSAPPPDVVTMYMPGFWRNQFKTWAEVEETIENESSIENSLIGLRILARRRWRNPLPIGIEVSKRVSAPAPTKGDRLWNYFERVVRRVGPRTGLTALAPARPQEFGLFIKMQKH
jgi:SAM-dependent methyltransferase